MKRYLVVKYARSEARPDVDMAWIDAEDEYDAANRATEIIEAVWRGTSLLVCPADQLTTFTLDLIKLEEATPP